MKKNQKGSALLWAVVLLLIFDVVIAGAMGITYTYYHRSVAANNQRQAYLTSKGLIENIVEKISVGESQYTDLFVGLHVGETNALSFEVPDGTNVGTARGNIEVNDPQDTRGRITITVTSAFDEEVDTVKADMQLGKVDNVEHWQLVRYYKGDPIPLVDNSNVQNAKLYLQDMNAILSAWRSTGKIGMNEQIQSDITGFANLQSIKGNDWYIEYFDNSKLRQYFYCRTGGNASWLEFDKTAIKNKKFLDNLVAEHYYIQTYFPPSSYTESIVYANTQNKEDANWGGVNLVYDAGHWYYIDQVSLSDFVEDESSNVKDLNMTDFNDNFSTPTTSSAKRWSSFKAKYLTKDNQID